MIVHDGSFLHHVKIPSEKRFLCLGSQISAVHVPKVPCERRITRCSGDNLHNWWLIFWVFRNGLGQQQCKTKVKLLQNQRENEIARCWIYKGKRKMSKYFLDFLCYGIVGVASLLSLLLVVLEWRRYEGRFK
jgi:hypothetical protein